MEKITIEKLNHLLIFLHDGHKLSTNQHLRLQNMIINLTTSWMSILSEDLKIKILYQALDIDPENVCEHFVKIWKSRLTIMSIFDSVHEYSHCIKKMMKEAKVVKYEFLFQRALNVEMEVKHLRTQSSISNRLVNKMDIMVVGKNVVEASCTQKEKLGNFLVFWSCFMTTGSISFENCLHIARAGSITFINFHEAKLLRDCGGKNAVSPFQKYDTFGFDDIPIWFINTDPCVSIDMSRKALRIR